MSCALVELESKIASSDTALIYFAGHGFAFDGTNFLPPVDLPAEGPARRCSCAMPLLPPTSSSTDCKRGAWPRRFLILDAYRGNPFPQSGMRSVGLTRGLTRVGPAECAFKPPPCDAADPNEVSEGATLYTKAPPKTASDAGRAHLCR